LIPKNAIKDRALVVAWLYESQRVGKSDVLKGQHDRGSCKGATEGLGDVQPARVAAWRRTLSAQFRQMAIRAKVP